MRDCRTLLLIAIGLFAVAWTAQGAGCQNLTPPPGVINGAITIDARTGSVTNGAHRFALKDQIRVVLFNKNSFHYSYEIKFDEKVIVESDIGKFLAFAKITVDPPKTTPVPPVPGQPAAGAPGPESINGGAQRSADCQTATKKLIDRNTELDNATKTLQTAIENAIKEHGNVVEQVKADLGDTQADAAALCDKANDALGKVDGFKVGPELISGHSDLVKLIETQEKAIDGLPSICKLTDAEKAALKAGLKNAHTVETWADDKLDELKDGKKEIDKTAENIKNTLAGGEAFWMTRTRGPFRESELITISVIRQDRLANGSSPETLAEFKTQAGDGQRFFMAGGIAASAAHVRRFKTVDGLTKDANGAATTKKIVGLEEDSVGRVAPAIFLHGMFHRGNGTISGLGLSLGVGATGTDESTIQYFVGPTASFADDHLFVTLGAFRGSEKKLDGNFTVGSDVPATVTLPVTDRRAWNFGFAITYRIQ